MELSQMLTDETERVSQAESWKLCNKTLSNLFIGVCWCHSPPFPKAEVSACDVKPHWLDKSLSSYPVHINWRVNLRDVSYLQCWRLLKIVLTKNPDTSMNWCVWAVLHPARVCSIYWVLCDICDSNITQHPKQLLKNTTSKALRQKEVKNYQVTSFKSSAKKSNARPASQMPTLCRKPKNRNCSNFRTYLQQGLTSPGLFF